MAEWAWVLRESSGAIVLRNAYKDASAIDEATQGSDYIWNVSHKTLVVDPAEHPLRRLLTNVCHVLDSPERSLKVSAAQPRTIDRQLGLLGP